MTSQSRTVAGVFIGVIVAIGVATILIEYSLGASAAARQAVVLGLLAGLAAGLLHGWLVSRGARRRVRDVAQAAARYRTGDFSRPARDFGRDEIGEVTRLLDDTTRELGTRLANLARERAHMDAILTGMIEGVVLVNAAGRLVLTNPAVREMLRLTGPTDGVHYFEVIRQPDIARQLAGALTGEQPAPVEFQFERDKRQTFVAHVVPVGRERGGGAVLVLHDITELRRADQMRRDFVANVSHELRTPLTAIRGYVEALADAPPPEEARQFIAIVSRHALRMERLVRDLLRLARLDAGQETLERIESDVAALIAAAQRDIQTQVNAREQEIVTAIAPASERVHGDPGKLQDILRNLLENASNYSPQAGRIEVATTHAGGWIDITIGDRGPGIPEADLPRIFERFYRVDRSRTRDPGGTGLGLSIVRHLVELHGGRVSAANRPEGGAIFTVRLPAPTAEK